MTFAPQPKQQPEFMTAGERLAGRTLEMEQIHGVPHYKPGQMRAEAYVVVWLSYVDTVGHLVSIPLVRNNESGEWEGIEAGLRAGQSQVTPTQIHPDWRPSRNMRTAIRKAMRRAGIS